MGKFLLNYGDPGDHFYSGHMYSCTSVTIALC